MGSQWLAITFPYTRLKSVPERFSLTPQSPFFPLLIRQLWLHKTQRTLSFSNVTGKWVNIIVSLYGRTLDVYIDGKLVRTCVLPGVAKVANNAPVYVTPMGGFSGYTSNIHYFSNSLNPQEAYNIYRNGYGASGIEFPYQLKIEYLKDGKEQGGITI